MSARQVAAVEFAPAPRRSPTDLPRRPSREGGFHLATFLGVRVDIDWSLFLVFALVLFNLGAGVLPRWHPAWSPWLAWGVALATAVLFFASVLVHELAHAVVARRHGIPISSITLFLFGGLAHMEREPPTPRAEFLMAIVGPVTSIVIGALATLAGVALAGPGFSETLQLHPETAMQTLGPVASLLLLLGPINVFVGVFNLVPGFPLDGGRVLRSILWWLSGSLKKATRWASSGGRLLSWVLMAWGVLNLTAGAFLPGVWLLLIGWFLNNAARQSYQQLIIRESLAAVPVSQLMRTSFAAVEPTKRIEAFVHEDLMATDQRAFPVEGRAGDVVGIICLDDVRRVPRKEWAIRTVGEAMTPVGRLASLPADAPAVSALKLLEDNEIDQVPIVQAGKVIGLVRRQDLLKWLALNLDERELSAAIGGQP